MAAGKKGDVRPHPYPERLPYAVFSDDSSRARRNPLRQESKTCENSISTEVLGNDEDVRRL